MLVVSRRKEEKIVFPGLGITVTLLNVKGANARIGIDAPRDVTVLRGEISGEGTEDRFNERDPHTVRNILNSVNLYVMLYQRQMESRQIDAAASTFMKMIDYLEKETSYGRLDFEVDSESNGQIAGNIMLVEDNDQQRGLLQEFLGTYGLQVTAFENGQKALREIQSGFRPEVAILDWKMPEFGGEWLVPKIHRELGASCPKLFVLSGTDRRPGNTGIDAWLPKPVNHEALLARLRAAYAAA